MGPPPAVVVIARHGTRLDAADKQWHLTSPTPYDPPLSYGGWTQSRALGVRIAGLLRTREAYNDTQERNETTPTSRHGRTNGATKENGVRDTDKSHTSKEKKHRIIIHSSPFLRCVQTSIAISAGLSQYQGHNAHISSNNKPHNLHSRVSHHYAHEHSGSPLLSPLPESEEDIPSQVQKNTERARKTEKPCLRLDAFLGEWLSPDYYESITPPPCSVLMVASAKADLLRRGTEINGTENAVSNSDMQGNFPGGWGSTRSGGPTTLDGFSEDSALLKLSSLAQALPHRDRSRGQSDTENSQARHRLSLSTGTKPGYVPPVPKYAISPMETIPTGYVAHARDACVDVDYQWDSMRSPQAWGDGGEYGEEWSSMHHRFRKGFQQMILWYRTHDADGKVQSEEVVEEEEDDNTDTVLILVTHGAGCNALIGAITNQPVLLDVGMASLTMAVRKDITNVTSDVPASIMSPAARRRSSIEYGPSNDGIRRRSSVDYHTSSDYDIRIVASTEHLRGNSSSFSVPSAPSDAAARTASPRSTHRHRMGSLITSPITDSPAEGAVNLPVFLARGKLNRTNTGPITKSESGLWSKPASDTGKSTPERRDSINGKQETTGVSQNPTKETLPSQSNSQHAVATQAGLWADRPERVTKEREPGLKRRWTMHDEHR